MTAGQLRYQIRFQEREEIEDEYGNVSGGWATKFTCFAGFKFLRGGEEVMAGRLAGKQPAIITVRSSDISRRVDTAWRILDREDQAWNIRAITDPTGKRAWLEILAEKGVAT
ncbi:phage head closure protein [Bosea sp. FBZP-16]|uniref:phage head closure protein n=1 Tax=Bosea sp. FBZP-16 TaxID=2065382 RepID=UPI000C30FC57|nr:phage head closure protein [Bosea sp. FBZP-16]